MLQNRRDFYDFKILELSFKLFDIAIRIPDSNRIYRAQRPFEVSKGVRKMAFHLGKRVGPIITSCKRVDRSDPVSISLFCPTFSKGTF